MPTSAEAMNNKKLYPPGGDTAKAQGCACDPIKNNQGRGYGLKPWVWLVDGKCPLHAIKGFVY